MSTSPASTLGNTQDEDAPDNVLAFEPTGFSSETSGTTSTIVREHAICTLTRDLTDVYTTQDIAEPITCNKQRYKRYRRQAVPQYIRGTPNGKCSAE